MQASALLNMKGSGDEAPCESSTAEDQARAGVKKLENKGDQGAVKHLLDELVADVVTSECEYPEDFTSSNVRILLSFAACVAAPASHFLPPYLEREGITLLSTDEKTSKNLIVLACVLFYAVSFLALLAFQYLHEKEAILFTKQKKGVSSSSGLRVSTRMERFDDVYKITVVERKSARGTTNSDPMTLERSITKWIDEDGVVAEKLVSKDVKRFVKAFEKSVHKAKKR